MGSVYGLVCGCQTCLMEGRSEVRYIGKTVKSVKHRFRTHVNQALREPKYPVHRWMSRHGTENIRVIVFHSSEDEDELLLREVDLIGKFGTAASAGLGGLNVTEGGEGITGYRHTEQFKREQSRRYRKQAAVKHPRSKLTRDEVIEVKRRIWNGEHKKRIADDYGVDPSSISRIYRGLNWKDVPWPIGPARGSFRNKERVTKGRKR